MMGLMQLEPGQGVSIVRIHDGALVLVPPDAPLLAQTPAEALEIVADWLKMPVGRPRPDPTQRFRWATLTFQCPVGSNFTLARLERAPSRCDQPGFIATWHLNAPSTLWQGALWTGLSVLDYVNSWCGMISMNGSVNLHALRIVERLDVEATGVFVVVVSPTALVPMEVSVPSRDAPYVLVSQHPALTLSIAEGPLADYFAKHAGPGETEISYAARFNLNSLEIGQRLDLDSGGEEDGEDEEDGDEEAAEEADDDVGLDDEA